MLQFGLQLIQGLPPLLHIASKLFVLFTRVGSLNQLLLGLLELLCQRRCGFCGFPFPFRELLLGCKFVSHCCIKSLLEILEIFFPRGARFEITFQI